jgi:hypothetical protein
MFEFVVIYRDFARAFFFFFFRFSTAPCTPSSSPSPARKHSHSISSQQWKWRSGLPGDQTGVRLCPSDSMTYESKNSKDVKVIGGDDKRQITVCVASSLHGDMLPLQLIFAGKTERCLPPRTQSVDSEGVHLTYSENHWSSQKTMQEWVKCVLLPYAHSRIQEHKLSAQSRIILVLDVWAVHKIICGIQTVSLCKSFQHFTC